MDVLLLAVVLVELTAVVLPLVDELVVLVVFVVVGPVMAECAPSKKGSSPVDVLNVRF